MLRYLKERNKYKLKLIYKVEINQNKSVFI